ncbi:EF-hand domain-containing protein [Sulfurovum mangrovi]|uniref:EF-hand domain-containing protein n=1 Tax=Sulfurovum mangrovi TaxID=2893889 RepID=UPI001E658141|nr:EF-hand domain-containing protein [Sulfurovum mangrovi]UFH58077.1 EF-hand domain-containing protein [Sulfurovum mangrovi]
MKKFIMITSLLVSSGFGADLSQVSTDELAQEMQKRMQSMTPQERQQYRGAGMMGMGQMGKCGNGMGKMKPKRMMQMSKFSDCDLNNDGVILEKEFQEARAKRMNQRAEEGRMLQNAGKAPMFADVDTNKDGKITQDEFQAHQQQMRMKNKGPQGKMGKCGNGMGKTKPRRMMQMSQFADSDLNNDGVILEKEFQEAREKRMNQRAEEGRMLQNAGDAPSFGEIDTNKDGKITQDEFQAHQQQMRMKNKGANGKCANGKCGR